MPAMGNQPSFSPKMYWERKPSTRIGIEMISVVDTSTRLSKKPLRRMPGEDAGDQMPMTVSKSTATRVSFAVTGQPVWR